MRKYVTFARPYVAKFFPLACLTVWLLASGIYMGTHPTVYARDTLVVFAIVLACLVIIAAVIGNPYAGNYSPRDVFTLLGAALAGGSAYTAQFSADLVSLTVIMVVALPLMRWMYVRLAVIEYLVQEPEQQSV
jgi:hypothetical protein